MIFSSFDFLLLFLPVTLAVYLLLHRNSSELLTKTWLLTASLVFYGVWRIDYLPLLLGSIGVNFALGRFLQGQPQRHLPVLVIGIALNLLLLGYYKYAAFLVRDLLFWLPIENWGALSESLSSIILPLGISFFTFQQIAYLVDSAARPSRIKTPPSLLDYSLFVSFFPQFIAGPIVHHSELIPQFRRIRDAISTARFAFGLSMLIMGLFKKVMIADPLSPVVAATFASGAQNSVLDAWVGALAYTYQLYFDFSGYADMAVGLAAIFGFTLPANFDRPYMAGNIQEFWRRWHMTLSHFLRDHVYIPLGGNRGGEGSVRWRLLVTMLLGGLWHGAAWNFVIWGAFHGVLLLAQRWFRALSGGVSWWIGWPLTLLAIILGWVLFRAPDLPTALSIYGSMIGWETDGVRLSVIERIPIEWWFAAPLILFWREETAPRKQFGIARALLFGIVLFLVLSRGGTVSEFLYFQF